MNKYSIYCTKEQTERAYKLGAPLEKEKPNGDVICIGETKGEFGQSVGVYRMIPTADQMRGWLKEKGVFVDITINDFGTGKYASAICIKEGESESSWFYQAETHALFDTYQEAMYAAIDKALDYLEDV